MDIDLLMVKEGLTQLLMVTGSVGLAVSEKTQISLLNILYVLVLTLCFILFISPSVCGITEAIKCEAIEFIVGASSLRLVSIFQLLLEGTIKIITKTIVKITEQPLQFLSKIFGIDLTLNNKDGKNNDDIN